jgi:hypothetical protein
MLPAIARKTGDRWWGLANFFAWAGLKSVFLISASWVVWDNRYAPLCPAIDWDGVLRTFPSWSQTSIVSISASQVAGITGMSHRWLGPALKFLTKFAPPEMEFQPWFCASCRWYTLHIFTTYFWDYVVDGTQVTQEMIYHKMKEVRAHGPMPKGLGLLTPAINISESSQIWMYYSWYRRSTNSRKTSTLWIHPWCTLNISSAIS